MSLRNYHDKIKALKFSDEQNLNLIIDQINASNIDDFTKELEIIEHLLNDLAQLVTHKNDHVLSKFCSLMSYLLRKQKVPMSASSFECLTKFLLSKITLSTEWIRVDLLTAFSALLSNGNQLKFEMVSKLFMEKSILLPTINQDKVLQHTTLHCLFTLMKNLGEAALPTEKLTFVCEKCLIILKHDKFYNETDLLNLKILVNCLKILQLVFSSKNARVDNIGDILGVLKNLSFFGLPGQSLSLGFSLNPTLPSPETAHLQGSQSESDASYPKVRKQKKSRRKVKKNAKKTQPIVLTAQEGNNLETNESSPYNNVNCYSPSNTLNSFKDIRIKSSSSDSEFSDVDSQASKIKSFQASTRQNAYQTLQAVVKMVDQKTMFGYWSSFLPDHPFMPGMPTNQTIFTTILKDPAAQVRSSALSLLMEMLRNSKHYLYLADGRSTRHAAFTSLSSILASMISEIHRCLLLALLAENSSALTIQILKCYAVLCENVPYSKINKDILFKFLKHIKGFVNHKDPQVQVVCLTIFATIINSDQTPVELERLILSADFDFVINNLLPNSTKQLNPLFNDEYIPWLVEVCQKNILSEDHLPIKIQSIQLLSSIAGKYFKAAELFLPVLKTIVLFCLNESDTSLHLHAIKLLDVIGRSSSNISEKENSICHSVSELFLNALSGPLVECLTNEEHKTVQAATCDCLSTVVASDFATLKPKQQILYISILLGLASDSNANVRGAAIRCLGIYCLFPCLMQDPSFYDDLGVILVKAVCDPNMQVRFKASWALGNLSDALFLNRGTTFSEEISIQFYHSLGMACIQFSKDCDRVKANAVRSLGNFLRFCPENYLDLEIIQEFIKAACETLLSALSSGFMKVCWNVCYAFQSMMKNEMLLQKEIIDLEAVLNNLISVLKSPNFKVRISAAQAISSLKCRQLYKTTFPVLWKQLLLCLQSSFDDVNFKEIKHQENLCDQLCHSLCQLASLLTVQDLSNIETDTILVKENLLTCMWRFGMHATTEKNLCVKNAIEQVTQLQNETQLCDSILTTLEDVLNQAVLACYAENPDKT